MYETPSLSESLQNITFCAQDAKNALNARMFGGKPLPAGLHGHSIQACLDQIEFLASGMINHLIDEPDEVKDVASQPSGLSALATREAKNIVRLHPELPNV